MKDGLRPEITNAPSAASGAASTRNWRHHFVRHLADRRNRRRIWLALASLLVVGALAATKGLIGYYLVGNRAVTIELAFGIAAVVAVGFGFGQRRLERALEARFTRNTREHRTALAALADEIAGSDNHHQLEGAVVSRFDALFGTRGSALYRRDDRGDFVRVAANDTRYPAHVAATDQVVQLMLTTHAPVAASELANALDAPMVWPLRIRGQLYGFLAAGEHDYIESFDQDEIAGVTELANVAAATLALLDPAHRMTAAAPRPSLPLHLSSFIGRDRDVAELGALLHTTRLLTVTGPVGIGKSRIVLAVAETLSPAFPGGVVWVDLGGCVRTDEVLPAIARSVGVDGVDAAALATALGARLDGTPTLLVLDGCEAVHDACAEAAGVLLAGAPTLVVAATSQQALGLPGEREYPLSSLATVGDAEAVELFVERARAVLPGFDPDPATRGVIVDICAALDGLPLAIELAAARMKYFDAATIRAGLEVHADALDDHRGDARPHARTMQASLAASFAHLTADERAAAHRLAQLGNPFTLAMATANTFDGDALRAQVTIVELLDKSWLCRTDGGASMPTPCYRMLSPLRRFALAAGSPANGDASGILDAGRHQG